MSCKPRTGRIHRALFPAFGITLVLVMAALFRTDVSPKASAWRERNVLLGHAGNVLTMVFSPDGRRLASGDQEGKIIVWDLPSETPLATLQHHEERLLSVAFCPEGHTLATGSSDGSIQLWNVAQASPIHTLPGHDCAIMGMVYTPDGQTLVSGSADGIVKLWDPSTGNERASWRADERAGFSCLAYSPDGATLATGSLNRTVKLWDLATHQEKFALSERGGGQGRHFRRRRQEACWR